MSDGPDLFAISPGRGELAEFRRCIQGWARGGLRRFLLREKGSAPEVRRQLALEVVPRCREFGIEPWISEDAGLARDSGAVGVHLSERCREVPDDLPYGLSLHRDSRRTPEVVGGARHVFLSPLFPTPAKQEIVEPISLSTFVEKSRGVRVPVYALGGITADRLTQLARRGIRRVAGIRLFFGRDPRGAVEQALERLAEDEACQ